jgi:hypothetical protein
VELNGAGNGLTDPLQHTEYEQSQPSAEKTDAEESPQREGKGLGPCQEEAKTLLEAFGDEKKDN